MYSTEGMAAADSHPSALRVFSSLTKFPVVAIAALGTLTIGWCFTDAYLWRIVAVSAFDWLLASVLNRAADLHEDAVNEVVGTETVACHAGAIRAVTLAVLFASIVVVHLSMPALTVIRVAFHALAFLYDVPVLPGPARIKQLYLLKNVAMAIAFLLTTFAYPLAGAHDALTAGVGVGTVLVTAVSFLLFEVAYELMADLRDAPGDEQAGIPTYALARGPFGVMRVVGTLCIASAMLLVVAFLLKLVPWRVTILAVGPLVQGLVYRRWLERGSDADDGARMAWLGVGLLTAYHLWVAFGLFGSRT